MVDMAQSDNVSVIDVLGMSVDELESMTYTGTSVESTNELVMVCTSDDENGEESLVRNNCLSDEVADGKHEQSDKHDTHYILETERCCTVESKQTTDYRVKRCGIGAAFITQHRPVKDILSANENSDGKKSKATLIEHCTVGSKLQINHHMESQGLVKQYICCYCSKTFKYQSHLLSHVNTHRLTHDEDACFTCDICKHEFRSSSGLRKHRRIHDAIQRHKCFVCAKTFPFASVLAEHERIHSASCLFLCDFCGLGFKQASNMRKHRCLMHELTDTSSCHHCGPDSQCVCPTKSSSASSKFQCPVCLKCFTNKSYKEMHLRVHSGERPYQCQICNFSFKQQSNLSKHMLSAHSGRRPFSCRFCGKTFAVKSNLSDHEKIHTDDRQFPCSLCSKRFVTAAALRAHVNHHDNYKKSGSTQSKVCK